MNNLIISLLISCTFFKSSESQNKTLWRHVSSTSKDSFEYFPFRSNETKIPYLDENLNLAVLDSLIDKGIKYDSMMAEYANKKTLDLPMPVIAWTRTSVIMYTHKRHISIDSCEQDVYDFIVNKGNQILEDDCYRIFYIKGFGLIACLHEDTQEISIGWDRYILIDIFDKDNKSLINKDKLTFLMNKIMPH